MKGFEMSELEQRVPDDPDAVDREPYIVPEPEDDGGPGDRPRPDQEEGAQRLPGEEAPERMLVGDSQSAPTQS